MQKGRIACYSPRKKNVPEVWPLLYYICENTTFKCRIWLSKNHTRKPFNRNSRERKLFKSWYSMKDYENGGHRMRRNCKHNAKNLLLCVNTREQFILLCWAIRGCFQLLEKEKERSHHVQTELFRELCSPVPRSSGQFLLHCTRVPRKGAVKTCNRNTGWPKTSSCIHTLKQD